MFADITVELFEHPTTGYHFRSVEHPQAGTDAAGADLAAGAALAAPAHAPNVGTLLTGRRLQPADASGNLRALGAKAPTNLQTLLVTLEHSLHLRFQQLPAARCAETEAQILTLCDRYGPLMPQDAPFQVLETAEFWLARAREMRELTERRQAGTLTDDDYEAVAGLVGRVVTSATVGGARVRSLLAGLWLQWCGDSERYAGICERCEGPKFTGNTRDVCSDLCRLR